MRKALWFMLVTSLLLGVGLGVSAGSRPAMAQGQNLLVNPSFEGAYSSYIPETPQEVADCPLGTCTTAQVPSGWKPWWVKERPTDVNPEYKPAEFANRIRSGSRAAQYFSFWSTHKAGLRQTVSVPDNAVVQFSVWGFTWMTESDTSDVSDYAGTPNMRIGIDPTGGTNPYGQAIVWSDYKQAYDSYQLFSVQAQAQGSQVTVFTFSAPSVNPNSPEYGFKHNDVYWDDAALETVGSAPPPPPPADTGTGETTGDGQVASGAAVFTLPPTSTPDAEGVIYSVVGAGDSLWSIAAKAGLTLDEILELNNLSQNDFVREGDLLIIGYGDPPGTESKEESETAEEVDPTATPTVPPPTSTPEGIVVSQQSSGASLCLLAFEDNNQNGQQDAGEALRPAVAFTISDGESVVSNYVTDGASEPFCIQGLNAGDYRVTRSSLANETMTTPGDRFVSMAEGSTLNLAFGSFTSVDTLASNTIAGQEVNRVTGAEGSNLSSAALADGEEGGAGGIFIVAVVIAVLLLVGVVVIILSSRRVTA